MKKIHSPLRDLKPKTKSATAPTPVQSTTSTGAPKASPTLSAPKNESPLKKAAELDSDPEAHPSSPAGSREVTGLQSKAASTLISEPPSFDELSESTDSQDKPLGAMAATKTGRYTEQPPTLTDNPIDEEQKVNIETPSAFEAGSPAPEFPDFKDQTPTSTQTDSRGNKTATYEQDGVTYTQKTHQDGTVYTTYTRDGVEYSQHSGLAGGGTAVSASSGDGKYFRTIATDAQGKVTDTSNSRITTVDPQTGESVEQSRVVVHDPEGNEVVTDKIQHPDGSESTLNRTVKPDGRVEETYLYEGEQGKRLRETKQAADGSAETRTEKSTTVNGSMNQLLGEAGISEPGKPEIPADPHASGDSIPNVEWANNQEMATQVNSVELVTTDSNGNSKLAYSEETYSQTTGGVEALEHGELATFPPGISPDNEGSSITKSVTRVRTLGEDGQTVESTGASQSFDLQGRRGDGSTVSLKRTDSWGSDGKSSSTVDAQGFTTAEIIEQSTNGSSSSGQLVSIDGSGYHVGFPGGKTPGAHMEIKGGGEVQNWIGSDPNAPLDVSQTVTRDASGNPVSDTTNFSTLDENGNGKTVSRAEGGGPVAWTYSNFSNNGEDYQRQTVFEGTDISIEESHKSLGEGQFETSTQTYDGGVSVGSSNASRVAVGQSDLDAMVKSGDLTAAQASQLRTDGPPYYVERYTEQGSSVVDEEGALREDANGNPIQLAFSRESVAIQNESGVEIAEQYSKQVDENGQWTGSRLSTTTIPDGNPPIVGTLESGTTNSDPHQKDLQTTEFSTIKVDSNGKMLVDGEELGQFDLKGGNLPTMLREGESLGAADLISMVGDVTGEASGWSHPSAASFNLTGSNGTLAKVSHVAGISGLVSGASDIFSGIGDGDWETTLGGVGDVAGGLSSVAAATSSIANNIHPASQFALRAGSVSTFLEGSHFGKVLGGLGGAFDIFFGAKELFTGDTGWDKAAGGLQVLAGAAAFVPGPGWVISLGLGLVSMFVANGDANDTAPLNPEFLNR